MSQLIRSDRTSAAQGLNQTKPSPFYGIQAACFFLRMSSSSTLTKDSFCHDIARAAGGAITSGLKKVSKDQMNHKNPDLVKSSVVKAVEKKPASSAPKFGAAAKTYDPVFELQGKKWVV